MDPVIKNKRTALERIDKYTSPEYFTDVNLHGRLYPRKASLNISHFAAPDRVHFSDVQDKDFTVCKVGDSFGPTWSTHWFKLDVSIPFEWVGNEVHLRWDSCSEALLFDASGVPIQGFSGGISDRSYYIITKCASENELDYKFYVEMACNTLLGAGGQTMIAPPDPHKQFGLQMVEISVFDREVYDLFVDLQILHDLAQFSSEDNPTGYSSLYAANEMINILTTDDSRSAYQEAKKISNKLFSETAFHSEHNIHALGHCHIDTAWLWPYAETIRKSARSWSSTLRLMEDYPDFTFVCSQAQQYQWVKDKYPSIFNDIKSFVEAGQFIPVGCTWVEMDGNIPSGESFIRQFLYGQKFYRQEFNFQCKELWLPDTFGYSGQLPQIMKICGVSRFLTQKISWNLVNKFPHHNFHWQGIDGSSVLVHFPPGDSYEMEVKVEEVFKTVKNLADKGRVNDSLMLYGYGDGGGGPTELMLERQKRLNNGICRANVRHSTPDKFFGALEADQRNLCTWVGELFLELHNGTYTTHHRIKQQNRRSEYSLRDAEFFSSVLLAVTNNADFYPSENLEEAWKLVLLNQFHDVIPGTSIGMVYDDAHRYYAEALGIAAEISSTCMQSLFGLPKGRIVIFNTLSWDRSSLIPIESTVFRNLTLNNSGVHHQDLSCGKKLIPVNLPSMGYVMVTELQPIKHCVIAEKLPSGLYHMKNQFMEVLIDSCGRIVSLKTFDNEIEAIDAGLPANQLVTFSDIPLFWDAWDVMDYHLQTRQTITKTTEEACFIEKGPLRATIHVKLQISAGSSVEQKISLDVVHPYVRIDTVVDWHESHKFLKVEFPVNVRSEHATFEIQFGHLRRPTHFNTSWDSARFEVCGHKWIDLSEYDWGVSIMNDSCYGHSVHGNVARMSLLRSPKSPDAGADMGRHEFCYAVYPHKGTFQSARVAQHAYELNVPVKILSDNGTPVAGNNRKTFTVDSAAHLLGDDSRHSWFSLTNPAVVLETIKKCEESSDQLVLRLYEANGSRVITELCTTLPVRSAVVCNALEAPAKSQILEWTNRSISLTFKPFEIKTLLVSF